MVDFHSDDSIKNKSDWYRGTRWAPCTTGCPAHTDARRYVTLAGEAKWREGQELLRRTYPFVASLGRVCPALDCLADGALSLEGSTVALLSCRPAFAKAADTKPEQS